MKFTRETFFKSLAVVAVGAVVYGLNAEDWTWSALQTVGGLAAVVIVLYELFVKTWLKPLLSFVRNGEPMTYYPAVANVVILIMSVALALAAAQVLALQIADMVLVGIGGAVTAIGLNEVGGNAVQALGRRA